MNKILRWGILTGLYENLHATTETEDEMESRFFLDIIVRQSPTVLELLASENQALLVRRDTFLVLNLALHIVDRIRRFDFESDSFSSNCSVTLVLDPIIYQQQL